MTENGGLVSMTGAPVLDAAGAPIQLDPGGGPPTIAHDGMISQNGRQTRRDRAVRARRRTPS